MNETLSQLICNTKEYSDVCDMCKDEILIYPTISGRTEYTQEEVEQITLKRIIGKLQAKEQKCKNLEEELRGCRIAIKDISTENTEICKISEKYKQALEEIEKYIQRSSSYYIPYGAREVIQNIINKAKKKNNG